MKQNRRRLPWDAIGVLVATIGIAITWKAEPARIIFFPPTPIKLPVLQISEPFPETRSTESANSNTLSARTVHVPMETPQEISLDKRLLLATTISNAYDRDDALAEIARQAATTSDEAIAFSAIGRIAANYTASEEYLFLARWCALLGRTQCAIKAGALTPTNYTADEIWQIVGSACNAAGDKQCVQTALTAFRSPYARDSFLREISK